MSRLAHTAFPSVSSSSRSRKLPPAPTNTAELRDLIESRSNLRSIYDSLIPLLQQVSEGKNDGPTGTRGKDRAARGEKLLSMPDEDLYGLNDETVKRMTAALVFIISARLNRIRTQRGHEVDLLAFASRLCALGDEEQLEMCRARTASLAWGLLRLAQHFKKPELAVQPVYTLVSRSSREGVLSGVHAALLEACLLARRYDHALPVIHELFTDVQTAAPSYLDVITFHHHAGLICAAMKDYAKATDFFCGAVSVPTQTASAVQLACAKRAILCELLVSGKLLHFPKYTSRAVTRMVERNAQEYTKLAKAFEAKDWAAAKVAEGKAEFAKDCNAGLLGQVLASVTRRRILQVKDMYSRMRMGDLATKVGKTGAGGSQEVTAVLNEMISTQSIRATLSTPSSSGSPIVIFHDEGAYPASTDVLSQIDGVQRMASWLEHQLSSASKHMGISPAYLKKQASVLEVTGGKGSGKNGKMDDFDAMMAAEELGDRGKKEGVGADYSDMGY